jgi:hypothetical protein
VIGILFLGVGHFNSNGDKSMTIVRNMFPGHLISRFGDVPWPPPSPDLLTCDFLLWEYLKEAIRQEIRPIDRQLLARVMDN